MKTVLLSPPYISEYMRNARCDFVSLSATQWYPILLGYCGAYLRGQGHEVTLIDAPAQNMDHEMTRQVVRDSRPDLIVLYTGRISERNDLDFVEPLIKELRCDTVIVGPFAGINPEGTLNRARLIDKLVVGEFEHPVGEIAAGCRKESVRNLIYKDGGRVVRNEIRPYLTGEQLDAIPFVSRFFRDHADIRRYRTPSELYPFLDMMSGRGCAWGLCTFCLWVNTFITGSRYNGRSIGNVIEELRFIANEMPQVRSVMLQDDTLTEERAREFCEAKLQAGIDLPWSCYARGNMSYEVLALMKRANCRNLHVGYESADPEVLRRIKKGISVERMTRFTADAKRAGLRIHGDFAIGLPGETPEAAQKTIEWALHLNPHTAQFQLMIPFPSTPYYEEMRLNEWLNSEGEPDMPQFPNEQIRELAKKAYRRFYLNPGYALQCICHPRENLFGRFKTIIRAIPAMFWRRWVTSVALKHRGDS